MNPDDDWTPINLLQNVSRFLYFEPGSTSHNGSYSSTGYNMAGLMWAAVLNKTSWEDVDVKSVIVPNPTDFPGFDIASKGPCYTQKPEVAHQYTILAKQVSSSSTELWFMDLDPFSCLNAWTAGGLQTSAAGLAEFWFT